MNAKEYGELELTPKEYCELELTANQVAYQIERHGLEPDEFFQETELQTFYNGETLWNWFDTFNFFGEVPIFFK